ncbi:MAG: polymerase [Blastocatellia bacterium]|jgi:DNA polymerase (family 10)|nr:polymerase [Blastocatellia bacterium]
MLDKFAIAAALQETGTLLEIRGGNDYFKARAYKAGARAVAELATDIGDLVRQRRLTEIKGVGNALAAQIAELYTTGKSSFLEKLRQELPAGIIELSQVPGLNLKKIEKLNEALGVASVADLRAAAEAGEIRDLKGFGAKTEQRILESIDKFENRSERLLSLHARRLAERIIEYMQPARGLISIEPAGSLRRWKETVGTVRLVAAGEKPASLIQHFRRYPPIIQIEPDEEKNVCVARLPEGVKVEFIAVRPTDYVATFFRATGSKEHLRRLTRMAAGKGGGSSTMRKDLARIKSEADIYKAFGMQYVPPELREDEGELQAALKKKLPKDLITIEDIQGMVHCHTVYSDGRNTVAEMAHAAEALGMKYLTITDHSPTASYAGGLTVDRLKRQWDEIDETQEKVKIKLLKGTESDITQKGALDYPDRILEKFDVIVASIHARYKMDEDQMTRRIVSAMKQPVYKIWGHALGRLIQRRPPFACRVEEILDVIAESRAAIEINGDPHRLDMEPRWLREARKRKIKFVISTDAHSTRDMLNLKFGVGIARRGWVRRGEVLNTLTVDKFRNVVRPSANRRYAKGV